MGTLVRVLDLPGRLTWGRFPAREPASSPSAAALVFTSTAAKRKARFRTLEHRLLVWDHSAWETLAAHHRLPVRLWTFPEQGVFPTSSRSLLQPREAPSTSLSSSQ